MARLSKFSAICHTCGKSSSDFIRRVYFENHIKSHEAGVAYIFANSQSGEQRYFKIMKYVKNEDKCDMTIFNSKKVLMYK